MIAAQSAIATRCHAGGSSSTRDRRRRRDSGIDRILADSFSPRCDRLANAGERVPAAEHAVELAVRDHAASGDPAQVVPVEIAVWVAATQSTSMLLSVVKGRLAGKCRQTSDEPIACARASSYEARLPARLSVVLKRRAGKSIQGQATASPSGTYRARPAASELWTR